MLQLRRDPGKVAPIRKRTDLMRRLSLVAAALLTGCSLFSSTTSWTRPGATPEQADADLASCKRVARAEQKTESDIEQDRSVFDDSAEGAVDTEVSDNIARHRSRDRFDDMVGDCMRQLGYSPAD